MRACKHVPHSACAIRHSRRQGRPPQEMNMKTRLYSIAAAAAIALFSAGCSTNPSSAQIGTGVGAVAGGVVGDALFGSTLGTVGGAAAGALIGNEIGRASCREECRSRWSPYH